MPEKKQDARVRYTKMMIRNSLLELLRTKPIAKITVTEICEMAGINRATFYAHYSDPSDLLHALESEIIEDVAHWVRPGADRRGQRPQGCADPARRVHRGERGHLLRAALGQGGHELPDPGGECHRGPVHELLGPRRGR